MRAMCSPRAGPSGLRQGALHEGTRTLTSPLLTRRRLGTTTGGSRRSQGRVLAFKGQPEPEPEGPAVRGAAKGAAPNSGPCATVTFKTCRRVAFGQELKVVGGLPQLGDWDCERAPAMTWSEGDQWLLTLQLPAGHHLFKVVQSQSGAARYDWEAGPNRELAVPVPEAAAHGAFTVVCEWGNTVSSLETLPEGELEMEAALSGEEEDEPVLRPEDLTAEPYSPNGDEDEAPVGAITTKGPGRPKMGMGSDAALHGEPAGSLKPSTEAAVKQELQKQALSGSPGGIKQGKEEEEVDSGDSSGGAGASGGQHAAGGRPQTGSGGSPPTGLQMAAAAAGLAALPVVGWSEYVLRTTGCGLPPGPGGLLGAAEGVSYLVVGGIVLWSLARKLGTGSGLPAGPAGALGAVEGGSWLAAAAGLGVLVLQWQAFGYIPSALPDSNCFGAGAPTAGFAAAAQAPGGSRASSQLASAPALTSGGSIAQAAPAGFGGPVRVLAGGTSLPQGNLLFSAAEGLLSSSGSIIETAETAAAAMAAAAAGQPPPAAMAAAVQHLQGRAMQAQQLAAAIVGRLAGDDGAAAAAAAQASQAAQLQAPQQRTAPQLEPLNLNPPRYKVRALLHSSWAALAANEKLRAMLEPVPLPAVARQAAAAAGSALEAVNHAAEASMGAAGQEQQLAVALGQRSWSRLLQGDAEAHVRLPPALRAWLPAAEAEQPAAAVAAAPAPDARRLAAAAAGPSRPASPVVPPAAKSPRAGSPASPAPAAKTAAVAAEAADAGKASPHANGISSEMLAGALADLKEGYVGLWHSALEFDPQQAATSLQERVAVQQAAQRAAQAKAAGVSTSKPAAASASKPTAIKPAASTSSSVKPAAAASSSTSSAAAAPKAAPTLQQQKPAAPPAAPTTTAAPQPRLLS